ncbi:MAG: Flp pilus assembly protein CpaB [Bdellovibrionales bacterium]|jgi:pilus assembly protein CpaB
MGNETRNLWLSIGAALFAVFLIYSYSQEKKAEYDKMFGAKKTIVRAKEDVPEMSTVYDTMLETVEVPANYVYPDTVTIPEDIIGHVAAVPLKKGQIIMKNMLFTPGPDTGISLQVAPNKRALSIPIDEVRGVSKLVRPGDRVDIVAAIDVGKGATARREVVILLEDVPILATGVSIVNNIPRLMELDASGKNLTQTSLTGDTKYSTVTIEASPKEAQDLIYLLSTSPGNLFFTLRNPNDRTTRLRLPSSTAESILGRGGLDQGSSGGAVPGLSAPVGFGLPSTAPRPVAAPQGQRPRN